MGAGKGWGVACEPQQELLAGTKRIVNPALISLWLSLAWQPTPSSARVSFAELEMELRGSRTLGKRTTTQPHPSLSSWSLV